MSLPGNTLSDPAEISEFLLPDSTTRPSRIVDYERGGADLYDPAQGINLRDWKAEVIGDNIIISPLDDPGDTTNFLTVVGLLSISLAFDQNMNPMIAYEVGGNTYLYWFDLTPNAYTTYALPAGCRSPALTMDDKRRNATLLNRSDALLFYLRDEFVCYRQQRERFLTERVLATLIGSNARIKKVGMNHGLRVQLEITGPSAKLA